MTDVNSEIPLAIKQLLLSSFLLLSVASVITGFPSVFHSHLNETNKISTVSSYNLISYHLQAKLMEN